MLYRVRIGEDEYLGTAEEVVAFMAQAEGAPGDDVATYMAGVAARVREKLGIDAIKVEDEVAFLESLSDHGVLPIQTQEEPSRMRVDPAEAIGDGPVAYGPNVDPNDVPGRDD